MEGVLCCLVLMVWRVCVVNVMCEVQRDDLRVASDLDQIPSSSSSLPPPPPPLLSPPPPPSLLSPPFSPPLSPPTFAIPPPLHHQKPKHRPGNKNKRKKPQHSAPPYHPKRMNKGKEIGYWFMGVVVVLQVAVVGFLVYKRREFANICSRHENCS